MYIISKLGRAPAGACQTSAPSDGDRHPQPASAVHSTRHCVGITSSSAPVMAAPPATDGDHLRLKYVLKSALRGLIFRRPAEAENGPPSQRPRAATRAGGTQPGPVPPPRRTGSASPMLRGGHLYHRTSTGASVCARRRYELRGSRNGCCVLGRPHGPAASIPGWLHRLT